MGSNLEFRILCSLADILFAATKSKVNENHIEKNSVVTACLLYTRVDEAPKICVQNISRQVLLSLCSCHDE
jgi:hypothetical protein